MKRLKLWFGVLLGFHPNTIFQTIRGVLPFLRDLRHLCKQKRREEKEFPLGSFYPMLADKFATAGIMSGDYFHQDLHVAKKIFMAKPHKHVDIGSRIDGFVTHVAVFREVEIFDIREVKSTVSNIIFKQADLMQLPADMENYCDSVSSLHAIEHFGLGRYGDPIDYYGHIKAIRNITKILKSGGTFYFSVPIGKQRIEFNAHRIFSLSYLWNLLKDNYRLISFSYVDDNGDFHEDVPFVENTYETNFTTNFTYGCGIFELQKI